MIEPQDMGEFAHTASSGSAAVYHVGYLASDRADPETALPRTTREREVDAAARIAWSLHDVGLVALVQRKITAGKYSYEMQKCVARRIERNV